MTWRLEVSEKQQILLDPAMLREIRQKVIDQTRYQEIVEYTEADGTVVIAGNGTPPPILSEPDVAALAAGEAHSR